MSTMSFGTAVRKPPAAEEPRSDQPLDAAWMVLEAANDLGDHATVDTCRRVIDANLNGRPASPTDMQTILNYFA
jgi:hypothetical protein